jgi:hypothetical protein
VMELLLKKLSLNNIKKINYKNLLVALEGFFLSKYF